MMSTVAENPVYAALLAKTPPRVIRTDEQNESYIHALRDMEERQAEWSAEEAELADLLGLLIGDFEEKHYGLPRSSPVEAIEFLMEQQGVGREELAMVLGSDEAARAALGGGEIGKEQIRRLSERFHVSPEIFF